MIGLHFTGLGQNVGINANGAAPHASALLDVSSDIKGVLIPRMTLVQRNNIASPATTTLVSIFTMALPGKA